MNPRLRATYGAVALSALILVGGCGGSDDDAGSTDAETTVAVGSDDTTADTSGDTTDDSTTDSVADEGSESFGIGIVTVTLDGNDNRIEFGSDDGTCEIDSELGTAKISVSLDGSTLDVDYDAADPSAATIKYTSDTLNVNAGAGASTPELTDVVLTADQMTGGSIFDSPDEGPDKTYLGEFDFLCP